MRVSEGGARSVGGRREMLVAAARALFMRHSYEKVTTTDIAKAAGVAAGLISHHFTNKRGLYLAVMRDIAEELSTYQGRPPRGDTLEEQIRHALSDHVAYIDRNSEGFVAMMRGGLGADPDMRALVEELRWNGARRILGHLGVEQPPPLLRATMRGWVGYFDEIMLDRLEHQDLDAPSVVDLAASNLLHVLRDAIRRDPSAIDPAVAERLESTRHDPTSPSPAATGRQTGTRASRVRVLVQDRPAVSGANTFDAEILLSIEVLGDGHDRAADTTDV